MTDEKPKAHICKNCALWAPILRRQMLGVCGRMNETTDRVDTCEHYDEKDFLK